MARIAGVDLPRGKRIEIALTYIYGIGRTRAKKILEACGVDPTRREQDLSDEEINETLSNIRVYKEQVFLLEQFLLVLKLYFFQLYHQMYTSLFVQHL